MKIRKSAEDYLETMLILYERRGYIRSIDIAEEMGFKKSSVSIATKRLRENGYITIGKDHLISFTPAGLDIATRMYDRHKVLTQFLISLGVDADLAREDACKIEHDLSQQSFEAIRSYAERL